MIINLLAKQITNVSALLSSAPTENNGVVIKFSSQDSEISYYLNDGTTPAYPSDAGWQKAVNNEMIKMAVGETNLWLRSIKDIEVDVELVVDISGGGGALPAGAATLAEQQKQTTELNLANELAYREATKTYTTLKTWAQYKVVDITGWAVGVVVGDFVYKEINKLTNALQWLKSDGVTTISAPPNEDVNVDQLTGDREISVVYSSVFEAISKTRTPTIKNGIYNFGTVETEGEWV